MENLNIKAMFQNSKWSPKLQKIRLYKLLNMIKYKSEWYGKTFIQIDRFYPSSQRCNICGYQKKRPNTQNTSMEMPNLRNIPPQRPQRSKKHLKRRTKNTKSNKCMKKYFFHRTRKSTGG